MTSRAKPKVRRKRSGTYHHGDLRRALIDAALRLMLARGWAGFSFAEICRAAGVSSAAPYRHFESKDHVLAAAAAEGFELLIAETLNSFSDEDWQRRLASCVSGYLGFAQSHPAHFLAMFGCKAESVKEPEWNPASGDLEFADPPSSLTEAAVREAWIAGERSFVLYAERLAAALADSPLAHVFSTPELARDNAAALWAMMHGVATLWLDKLLDDAWLAEGARKTYERIVLPWALGQAAENAGTARRPATKRARSRRREMAGF